tara:strand:+ start:588 stop:794 length:207 start_codon:yes stop_codon:yes gene_type:complete
MSTNKKTKSKGYTVNEIKYFQDMNDLDEFMVLETLVDPYLGFDGASAYMTSGSMEDIPYDDITDNYLD